MMRTLKSYIIIFFLLQTCLAVSQIKVYDNEMYNSLNDEKRINIKIVNNQIIVPLEFNNSLTLNFILDSGVSLPILVDPIATDMLGLEYVRDIQVRGYGREEPLQAILAKNFEFTVAGLQSSKPIGIC